MRILLLAGGDSNERTVSLKSGEAVYQGLSRLGHKVYVIDPSTGKSLLGSDGSFIDYKSDPSKQSLVSKGSTWSLANALGSAGFRDIDVVFITLHGGSGENGMIQCLLDLAGKKYTGSNMTASAIAMDKAIAKRLCKAEGIPTPEWALYRISEKQPQAAVIEDIKKRFKFPVIVKPNDGGSTIGLTKVDSENELSGAIEKGLAESSNLLVEQFVAGKEVTAAVLDGQPLPLVQIRPKAGLYDFEAKYTKGKTEYLSPAPIDEKVTGEIQRDAARIYDVIGAAGLARVDFILTEKNEHYFLELNTLPGMTELSLAPMAAKAAGIDFDRLLETLIKSVLGEEATKSDG
jgi:D-alanine-D-alanine ligase